MSEYLWLDNNLLSKITCIREKAFTSRELLLFFFQAHCIKFGFQVNPSIRSLTSEN